MLLSPTSDLQADEQVIPQVEDLGRALSKQFKAYGADAKLSILQLLTTLVPFVALMAVMGVLASRYYVLVLLLAIPTAGLLVRLFIIQHDCGHGSFFSSRAANDWLGRAISLLTLTPYASWKQGHAAHHACTGNLDRRGRGDVDTWTVAEYQNATSFRQRLYRLYRNPSVMVGIGAPINFVVLQRLPLGRSFRDPTRRGSILGLDLSLLVAFGASCVAFGAFNVLATYLPVIVIASWIGNWLFYVQHQFEGTHWEREDEWNFYEAALSGSSYFKLPKLLQWFSGISACTTCTTSAAGSRIIACRPASMRPRTSTTLPKSSPCARALDAGVWRFGMSTEACWWALRIWSCAADHQVEGVSCITKSASYLGLPLAERLLSTYGGQMTTNSPQPTFRARPIRQTSLAGLGLRSAFSKTSFTAAVSSSCFTGF